jgi:hypothetical protein
VKRTAAKLVHLALVCALALGTAILPSLSRCVDAAGHDEIELSNADCCEGNAARAGLEPAGACIGGCVDGRLVVPSLSRSVGGKDAADALLSAVPLAFSLSASAGPLFARVDLRRTADATGARALRPRSPSLLRC